MKSHVGRVHEKRWNVRQFFSIIFTASGISLFLRIFLFSLRIFLFLQDFFFFLRDFSFSSGIFLFLHDFFFFWGFFLFPQGFFFFFTFSIFIVLYQSVGCWMFNVVDVLSIGRRSARRTPTAVSNCASLSSRRTISTRRPCVNAPAPTGRLSGDQQTCVQWEEYLIYSDMGTLMVKK